MLEETNCQTTQNIVIYHICKMFISAVTLFPPFSYGLYADENVDNCDWPLINSYVIM